MIGSGILVLVKRGGGAARPGPCEGKSESKSRSDSEIDYADEDDNDGERDSWEAVAPPTSKSAPFGIQPAITI